MANQRIDELNTLTESTIATGDIIPVYDITANDTKGITKQDFDQSIGDVVDSTFAITDNSDSTKKVQFQVSGVTTGTTRTLTVPDATTTVLGTDATQTVTNKTIDPSLNTIDGDKLDITYTPTNYTPTDTSETDDLDDLTAHLKGIDTVLGSATSSREMFIYPQSSSAAASARGDFYGYSLPGGAPGTGTVRFVFKIPSAWTTVSTCHLVVIPGSTTAFDYSVTTDFGASGEAYSAGSDSTSGTTATLTDTIVTEIDLTASITGVTGGDYVGMIYTNTDASNLFIIGLRISGS